jgi:transcriptional regulator of met regulon
LVVKIKTCPSITYTIKTTTKTNNTNSKVQQLVINTKKSNFSFDLCKALMSSNILLHNIHFQSFLEKYTGKEIPTVTTLRKTYVNDCYDDTMKIIRNYVTGKKI